MFNKFFSFLKTIFYIANFILISLYIFPGSILGWLFYGNAGLQPQITSDFLVSSNHVYAFILLSILGYFSYEKTKLSFLFIYLFDHFDNILQSNHLHHLILVFLKIFEFYLNDSDM